MHLLLCYFNKQSTFFNTIFTLTKCKTLIFQGHTHTKIQIHHPLKTFILTKSGALLLSGHLQDDKTQVAHPSRIEANKMQRSQLPRDVRANVHTYYPFKDIHLLKRSQLTFLAHIHANVQSSRSYKHARTFKIEVSHPWGTHTNSMFITHHFILHSR